MRARNSIQIFIALALILVLGAGCASTSGSTSSGTTSSGGGTTTQQQSGSTYGSGTATGDTQEGANFAQWVLEQDPQHQLITDAVVRNNQTLGVKVTPTATKGDIRNLMVALAQGMAKTFPGTPLRVEAFYQSGDKLAEANYDPNTNQVNVQFTS